MNQNSLLSEESGETRQAVEINNALAVILGNAQLLLLKNTVAPEDRAKLKAIEQSSFRIQELVERLLHSRNTDLSQTSLDERIKTPTSFNSTSC
jgi:nitrogen-specific signal transduction histidine kinase